MSELPEKGPGAKFVSKERDHLDALHRRLDFLRSDEREDPARHISGELGALAWALDIIEGHTEPVEIKLERYARKLRIIESRLGRLEKAEEDEDEEWG